MKSEHRRAARVAVDLPASTHARGVRVEGRAANLSQDGLLFHARQLDLPFGSVGVELRLPDIDEPIALVAEVRWVKDEPHGAGMGVRFLNVVRRDRLLLANFVLRRSSVQD